MTAPGFHGSGSWGLVEKRHRFGDSGGCPRKIGQSETGKEDFIQDYGHRRERLNLTGAAGDLWPVGEGRVRGSVSGKLPRGT